VARANGAAGAEDARRALAPHLYRDPRVADAELARVIERNWQLAGHISRVPEPGDYITVQVGTQPVLVMRDAGGELRAFRNVCRHRGSRLLSGEGNCGKAIRCRYHGWTYRHDGSLIGVPELRGYEGRLDKSKHGLIPARIEELCGLLFVNLDPLATDLAPQLGDLPARLARYRIADLEPFSPYEGSQPVNWKIVVDNYLEGYHVPIAHPGLMRLYDYGSYDVELGDGYAWFEAPLRDEPSGGRRERLYRRLVKPMPGLDENDGRVWRYIFIYPNTAIDLYPDQVMTWQINPNGPRGTRDVFMAYRESSPGVRTRAVQWLNAKLNWDVHKEDVDLVTNVQAGMETRGYEPGPLAAKEAAVGWFAERIRADLGPYAKAPEEELR
jgi:Rieske 2Fe-2S family protein